MYPVLFSIGDFPIHSYGFLIALGFLLCVWVSKREGQRLGISGERIVDLGFWSLLIGMIGARIIYVITRWNELYRHHLIEILYVWEGGLVFWGGPLLCIPFFLWYTKKFKLPRWQVLDIGATAIPLAHAFGRLGCFSVGCCHGRPTNLPWGIRFDSDLVEESMRGIPLHPTQIYESLSLLVLFFVLRRMRFSKKFDGQATFTYLIAYSIIRSVIEIYRGDTIRGFVVDGWISTSQFISILVITSSIFLYIRRENQACKPKTTLD